MRFRMTRTYAGGRRRKTQPVNELQAWFPRKDSNLRSRIQSPLPYRLATRDRLVMKSELRRAATRTGLRRHNSTRTMAGLAVTSHDRAAFCPEMRKLLLVAILVAATACGAY